MENYFDTIENYKIKKSREEFLKEVKWTSEENINGGKLRGGFNEKKDRIVKEWTKDGFNAAERLEKTDDSLIEVAGPTDDGYYELLELGNLDKKIFMSNIKNPVVWADGSRVGKINFQADALRLPFKDNSVGAVFCSCIAPPEKVTKKEKAEFRKKIAEEAIRVLKKGGLIIWKGLVLQDLKNFDSSEVELMQFMSEEDISPTRKEESIIHRIYEKII